MDSVQATIVGCGLLLAGLAADNFDAHRWRVAGQRTPIDALTLLSVVLPIVGLLVIAAATS